MGNLLHQIHAHVFQWEGEDVQSTEFVHEHDALGHGNSTEEHAYAPAAVLPAEPNSWLNEGDA